MTTVVLAALGLALAYAGSCVLYPYRACRTCRGRGHHVSSFLRAIRLCGRCDGDGRELRAGRRAYETWRRSRRRGRNR
ncbi:hypothetical protein JOF56_011011 [Kibdelosporangium banguiense]|uniref:Uncharacterized protein n=1 Tax=Kibdelosporangium banguiense TaxID=1365924 RepID=A0ABS4U387_9PSEU|nr:hypothetical protein [Kibdelosporangium banguiense]MBP2330626.1 hypothetical protein [Kibdelosporangium banguiense]